MKLETDRLYIIPLSKTQLQLYILNDNSLETELQLNNIPRVINERVAFVINTKILPALSDNSKDFMYYTFWNIIDKKLNVMVGDLCFKGEPNEKGEIELGYGTYNNFENKGYMTEAVNEIINWAFKQPHVKSILAQTYITNIASLCILKKNNFIKYDQSLEYIFLKIEKKCKQ